MLMGKLVRLNRLMNPKSGKMLSVAIDHTVAYGMIPGLEPVQRVVDQIVEGQPDSVTLQKGILERCFEPHAGRVGIILQSIAASPFEPDVEEPVADVAEALALGADAISVAITFGGEGQAHLTSHLGRVVRDARSAGLPVVAHCYPKGAFIPEDERMTAERVLYAARCGAELGVDIVKTFYTGSPESFATVTEAVPTRVVAAGGPKQESLMDVLVAVRGAIDAGAAGVTYGRNIWQDPKPGAVIAAIKAVVHDGVAPEEAAELYRQAS